MSALAYISIVWLASEIVLARMKRASAESSDDKNSLKIIWATIMLSGAVGIYLHMLGIGEVKLMPDIIKRTGMTLIVTGLAIRWIAILTLKKFFTVNVAVDKNHQLATKGIYKLLRHPAYLGTLISFLGLGLALPNYISTVVIFIPVFLAFNNRMRIEEEALTKAFGEEYIRYIKVSKRMLPFIY